MNDRLSEKVNCTANVTVKRMVCEGDKFIRYEEMKIKEVNWTDGGTRIAIVVEDPKGG
jgi:hypothetical protein